MRARGELARSLIRNACRVIRGPCRRNDPISHSELAGPAPRPSPKQIGPSLDAMLIFVYMPVLIFLPVLLIVGILFLVVPGGFIVVAGAVYSAWLGLMGLVAAAATTRRHAARVSRPRGRTSVARGLT